LTKRYGVRSPDEPESRDGQTNTPGLKTAPKPNELSSPTNTETPMLPSNGIQSARKGNGAEGTGCGKKRKPFCNGADSPNGQSERMQTCHR